MNMTVEEWFTQQRDLVDRFRVLKSPQGRYRPTRFSFGSLEPLSLLYIWPGVTFYQEPWQHNYYSPFDEQRNVKSEFYTVINY